MKKSSLLLVLLLLSVSFLVGQETDKSKIERSLLDYLEGFYEGDTMKIKRSISPTVVKYGYWRAKQSTKYEGEPMSFQEMIDYANTVREKKHQAPATAPKKTEVYDILNQTASAKVTAWWGTDYILLEKVGEKWMIRMVLWQSPPAA